MYEIIGTYQGFPEVIDTAPTIQEVEYLIGEYRLAFGSGWTFKYKKVKDEDA